MKPILLEIPGTPIKVFGYGALLTVAFLSAMYLAAWRARREKLNPEVILDLAFWIIVGGVVGARGFYVWEYWGDKIKNFWQIFEIWKGGIVLYGSIMGGTVAFLAYWWFRRFPLLPTLDAIAPSLALGIALGRLGCFLNGCCYGDRCDLPWAVRFPAHSSAWNDQVDQGLLTENALRSLPVHPTQIYSFVDGLVLWILLSAFYPLRRRDGEVMALLMVTYPITRFLVEYLRSDERAFVAGMTISQAISLLVIPCGLALWGWLSTRPAARFADQAPPSGAGGVVAPKPQPTA